MEVSFRKLKPEIKPSTHTSLSNICKIRKYRSLLYRSLENYIRITQETRREPRTLENVRDKSLIATAEGLDHADVSNVCLILKY